MSASKSRKQNKNKSRGNGGRTREEPELEVVQEQFTPAEDLEFEDPMSELFRKLDKLDSNLKVFTAPGDAMDLLARIDKKRRPHIVRLKFLAELLRSKPLLRLVEIELRTSVSEAGKSRSEWKEVQIAARAAQEAMGEVVGGPPIQ